MAKGSTRTKSEKQDAIMGQFDAVIRSANRSGSFNQNESVAQREDRLLKESISYHKAFESKEAAIAKFDRENKPEFAFRGIDPVAGLEMYKKLNAEYSSKRKTFIASFDKK